MKRIPFLTFIAALLCFLALAAPAKAQVDISDRVDKAGLLDLFEAIADTLGTRTFTDGGSSNSSADLLIANTLQFSIGNVAYNKTTATIDLSGAGTWAAQPAGTACNYLFHVDSGGTVNATVGTYVDDEATPTWPAAPLDEAVFAGVKVVTNSTATFTLGTTVFGTGNTATFYDLSASPALVLTR